MNGRREVKNLCPLVCQTNRTLTLWTETGPSGLIAVDILEPVDFFTILDVEDDEIRVLRDEQL